MTESGLRRKADREGYRLVGCRGAYQLFDHAMNLPVNAGFHDLQEVEEWLK